MRIVNHFPLRDILPFQTGGAAEFYTHVTTLTEVLEAIKWAQSENLPWRVIGNGTGILVSDGGYPGLIIHNRAANHVFLHDRSQVLVESGMSLSRLISLAITAGYAGAEHFVGARGTVGAAILDNYSQGGFALSNLIKSVTVYEPNGKSGSIKRYERAECDFEFGTSRFRSTEDMDEPSHRPIILNATLQLSRSYGEAIQQKLALCHKQLCPEPQGSVLQLFRRLRLPNWSEAKDDERARLRGEPYITVPQSAVKLWKLNAIELVGENPNFVRNTGLGTSHDAWAVAQRIMAELDAHNLLAIDRIGVWADD